MLENIATLKPDRRQSNLNKSHTSSYWRSSVHADMAMG